MELEKQHADVEVKRKKAIEIIKTMEEKLTEQESRVRAPPPPPPPLPTTTTTPYTLHFLA